MEPVTFALSETVNVTRYVQKWHLALDASDLHHAAEVLRLAAEITETQGSKIGAADIRRIAANLESAAKIHDEANQTLAEIAKELGDFLNKSDEEEKYADRAEQDRADAEHQAKAEAVEDAQS